MDAVWQRKQRFHLHRPKLSINHAMYALTLRPDSPVPITNCMDKLNLSCDVIQDFKNDTQT
jgi:hypothetical protein